jgi:hypothetical protein
VRPDFNIIKQDIFRGESGGDYDALFNYMNRSGGMFDDVKITDMTVDGALDFATLSGPGSNYASYVGIQNDGVKATPMGAYQVVGTTLRDAKRGLGLRGDELMTRDLQDRIGRYIYDTQGTGAWAGYKGPAYGPANVKQEAAPMLPAQQQGPRGLLEQFGLQKMQPGAAGETGQKFYNRDSFKDAAGRMAVGLNSLRLRPDPNLAGMMADVRNQRTEKNARNKTVEYLRANGMSQYADMIEAGQLPASQVLGAIMQQSMATPKVPTQQDNYGFWLRQGLSPEDARAMVASGTSINLGGEGKFEDQLGKGQANFYMKMAEEGVNSTATLGQINVIQALLNNTETGAAAAWGSFAQQKFGLPTSTSAAEALNAQINQLVPAQRPPGSGTMSDADLALFKASLPQLINSPEGNQIIVATMRGMAEHKRKLGDIANAVMLGDLDRRVALKQMQELPDPMAGALAFIEQLPTSGGGNEPTEDDRAEARRRLGLD